MNFFGHSVVASLKDPRPAFALGAMLPDFATMLGAREPRVSHDVVADGVRFHHATDRVFHESAGFRALQSAARKDLRERNLPRASALAVAHIGVEILLDGALATDERRQRYAAALRAGHPQDLGAHLDWDSAETSVRYAELHRILADRSHHAGHGDTALLTFRIARALEGRPRFRLTAEGERIVAGWVEERGPDVRAAAPALLAEVRSALELP